MNKKALVALLVLGCMSMAGFTLAAGPLTISLPNPLCPPGTQNTPRCIDTFGKLIDAVTNFVISVIAGLAVIMFVWAGILFLTSGYDPAHLEKAKSAVKWAVIGVGVAAAGKGLVVVAEAVIGSSPAALSAAAVTLPGIPNQINDLNTIINGVLNLIWPLFIAFAVIMFIIAGFMFLKAQGEAAEVKEARNFVIWGIIGIMVAVMAFTIPYFIQQEIAPTPEESQQCTLQCQNGWVCSMQGGMHCEAPPQQGAACTGNADCDPGHICLQNGRCSIN